MKKGYSICLILFLFSLVGCDSVEDSVNDLRAELNRDIAIAETDMSQDDGEITIEETYETIPTKAEVKGPTVEVELYFVDQKGEYLVKSVKEIPKEEGIARATIKALLEGPFEKEQISPIPSGTKLLDIHIQDELCIVDLSKEFLDAGKGLSDENLAIQSIVQTLCQFDTVKKVEFRVEGEGLNKLNESYVAKEVFADS